MHTPNPMPLPASRSLPLRSLSAQSLRGLFRTHARTRVFPQWGCGPCAARPSSPILSFSHCRFQATGPRQSPVVTSQNAQVKQGADGGPRSLTWKRWYRGLGAGAHAVPHGRLADWVLGLRLRTASSPPAFDHTGFQLKRSLPANAVGHGRLDTGTRAFTVLRPAEPTFLGVW